MALVIFHRGHAAAVETGAVGVQCLKLCAVFLLHKEWAAVSDWGCPWLLCKAHVGGGAVLTRCPLWEVGRHSVGKVCRVLLGEGICSTGTEAGLVGGDRVQYKQVR